MDTMPLFIYVVLRIEPSASYVLGKCSTTEPQPQPKRELFKVREVFYLDLDGGYTGICKYQNLPNDTFKMYIFYISSRISRSQNHSAAKIENFSEITVLHKMSPLDKKN